MEDVRGRRRPHARDEGDDDEVPMDDRDKEFRDPWRPSIFIIALILVVGALIWWVAAG